MTITDPIQTTLSKVTLTAKGRFVVSPDQIKIVVSTDFCKYYRWLYTRDTWFTVKSNIPKHGAHINVVNPKVHGKKDCLQFQQEFDRMNVTFTYDIGGNYGGFTKGFMNFWLDVSCKEAEHIHKCLGIKPQQGFSPFHITIFNTKNT